MRRTTSQAVNEYASGIGRDVVRNSGAIMKYYAVCCVKKEHDVSTPFGCSKLALSWADGMCGVMPVFTNKRLAKQYAGKGLQLVEFVPKQRTTGQVQRPGKHK